MKNQERQNSLNKKKWLNSEKEGRDMSGCEPYCEFCVKHETPFVKCKYTQQERDEGCLCAKAFNRMKRA